MNIQVFENNRQGMHQYLESQGNILRVQIKEDLGEDDLLPLKLIHTNSEEEEAFAKLTEVSDIDFKLFAFAPLTESGNTMSYKIVFNAFNFDLSFATANDVHNIEFETEDNCQSFGEILYNGNVFNFDQELTGEFKRDIAGVMVQLLFSKLNEVSEEGVEDRASFDLEAFDEAEAVDFLSQMMEVRFIQEF